MQGYEGLAISDVGWGIGKLTAAAVMGTVKARSCRMHSASTSARTEQWFPRITPQEPEFRNRHRSKPGYFWFDEDAFGHVHCFVI